MNRTSNTVTHAFMRNNSNLSQSNSEDQYSPEVRAYFDTFKGISSDFMAISVNFRKVYDDETELTKSRIANLVAELDKIKQDTPTNFTRIKNLNDEIGQLNDDLVMIAAKFNERIEALESQRARKNTLQRRRYANSQKNRRESMSSQPSHLQKTSSLLFNSQGSANKKRRYQSEEEEEAVGSNEE